MEFEVDYLDELKEKQEQRGRTGFVIQYKYLEAMSLLNDEERSEFLLAMYEYDLTGVLPELSKRVRAVLKTLKYDIDKTRDVWERNNKNSRTKQLPSGNFSNAEITAPSEVSRSQNGAGVHNINHAEESASSENARSLNGNAEANTNSKEENPLKPRFVPPTAEEVKAFAEANKIEIDARDFVDYYESNGWMVGRNKMNNWQAALSRWARNGVNSKVTDISKSRKSAGFSQREFDEKAEKERRVREMIKEGERIERLNKAKEQGG